jgi:hypothetical protein
MEEANEKLEDWRKENKKERMKLNKGDALLQSSEPVSLSIISLFI